MQYEPFSVELLGGTTDEKCQSRTCYFPAFFDAEDVIQIKRPKRRQKRHPNSSLQAFFCWLRRRTDLGEHGRVTTDKWVTIGHRT